MINWKLRMQNKVTLTTLGVCIVTFVYQVLAIFGINSPISENDITNLIMLIATILAGIGIVHDPTTEGFGDSERALTYTEPHSAGDAHE